MTETERQSMKVLLRSKDIVKSLIAKTGGFQTGSTAGTKDGSKEAEPHIAVVIPWF